MVIYVCIYDYEYDVVGYGATAEEAKAACKRAVLAFHEEDIGVTFDPDNCIEHEVELGKGYVHGEDFVF